MNIKRSLLLVCALVLIALTTSAQSSGKANNLEKYKGVWVEYWSYDGPSDVKYNDSFHIDVQDGRMVLSSIGPHYYGFKKISLLKGVLSFDLINENYTLPYSLKLNKTKDAFYGTATGIDKKTVKIKWQKIPYPEIK